MTIFYWTNAFLPYRELVYIKIVRMFIVLILIKHFINIA